jgi:hypothetical protein
MMIKHLETIPPRDLDAVYYVWEPVDSTFQIYN